MLLLIGASVHAQSTIFSTIYHGAETLIGEQLTRYGQFSSQTQDVASIHIIQIGDLASLQQNGLITITLPDSECDPIIYKMKNIEYGSPSNYTWYGEVDRSDTSEWRSGNLMLIAENNAKFGYLTKEDRFYNIEDLTNGKQALLRAHPQIKKI